MEKHKEYDIKTARASAMYALIGKPHGKANAQNEMKLWA